MSKGPERRNENIALVEANWPTNWSERDRLKLHAAIVDGLAARGLDVPVRVHSIGGGEWEVTCPDHPGFLVGGRVHANRTLDDLAALAVRILTGAVHAQRENELS